MKAVRIILRTTAFALISLVAGCTTTKQPQMSYDDLSGFSGTILVVPPIAVNDRYSELRDDLGNHLHTELSRVPGSNVVNGTVIPALEPLRRWDNLVKNGEVQVSEVATIARTLACRTVIVGLLHESTSYPPQRLTLELIWLDAMNPVHTVATVSVIDLKNESMRDAYQTFVTGSKPKSRLMRRNQAVPSAMHTALISPREFRRFAAAFSLQDLLTAATDIEKDSKIF